MKKSTEKKILKMLNSNTGMVITILLAILAAVLVQGVFYGLVIKIIRMIAG